MSMNCDIKNSEVLKVSRTQVDIKHDSQHGSYYQQLPQVMKIIFNFRKVFGKSI